MPDVVPILAALLIALPGIFGVVYVVRFKSGGLESAQLANAIQGEQLSRMGERIKALERRIEVLEWVNYRNAQALADLGAHPVTIHDAEVALGYVAGAPPVAPSSNGLDAANSLRRFITGDGTNPPAFSIEELNQLVANIGWNPDSLKGVTIEERAASAVSMAARLGELARLRDAAYKARPGRRIE